MDFKIFSAISNFTAFPVLWADECAMIDEDNVNKFKDEVQTPVKLVDGLSIGLGLVCGGVFVLVSWLMVIFLV